MVLITNGTRRGEEGKIEGGWKEVGEKEGRWKIKKEVSADLKEKEQKPRSERDS